MRRKCLISRGHLSIPRQLLITVTTQFIPNRCSTQTTSNWTQRSGLVTSLSHSGISIRRRCRRGGHVTSRSRLTKRRHSAVSHACERGVSERHACLLLGQPRGTQRYRPTQREDEDALTQATVTLASQYGRYGIAGSRRCSSGLAGTWARTESNTSGVAKG